MVRNIYNQASQLGHGFEGAVELLAQAGFRKIACYQILQDQLVLRVAGLTEDGFEWPASVQISALFDYNANRQNLLPVGWLRPRKKIFDQAFCEKNMAFYFPDQRLADYQVAIAIDRSEVRGNIANEISLRIERIAQNLIHLLQQQLSASKLNEYLLTELRRQLGNDIVNAIDHEIRTPLSVLEGCVQEKLLQEPTREDRGVFNLMVSQVKRTTEALDRFRLGFLEEVTSSTVDEHYNLIDLIEQVQKEQLESLTKQTPKIQLVYDDTQTFLVKVNASLLKQSFLEVLVNAARHVRADLVKVTVYRNRDWVVVDFVDGGPGVRAGSEELIFLRYYRESVLQKRQLMHSQGLGLGLYVARRLVEEMGGQLHYVRGGEGSGIFRFLLSRANEEYRSA